MNKEQQIEEMARVACEHFDCDMVGQPCTKCKTYDKHCYTIHQAEILYNAGYRKVPDGAVILTPEERDEELKACNEKQAELEAKIEILKIQNNNLEIAFDRLNARSERLESNMKSVLEIEKRNAVKEFAKKCKERINADYVNGGLNNHKGHLTEYDIDELIKEFTE